MFFASRRNSSAKSLAPTGTMIKSAPSLSDTLLRLELTPIPKEIANIRSETKIAIETIRIVVLNLFLLRFLRATIVVFNLT
ncbi:MAG: hypothetical protein Fur0020_08580 [Thermodesulfovibrionia bacterium]